MNKSIFFDIFTLVFMDRVQILSEYISLWLKNAFLQRKISWKMMDDFRKPTGLTGLLLETRLAYLYQRNHKFGNTSSSNHPVRVSLCSILYGLCIDSDSLCV